MVMSVIWVGGLGAMRPARHQSRAGQSLAWGAAVSTAVRVASAVTVLAGDRQTPRSRFGSPTPVSSTGSASVASAVASQPVDGPHTHTAVSAT